jgi:hypothetical protein
MGKVFARLRHDFWGLFDGHDRSRRSVCPIRPSADETAPAWSSTAIRTISDGRKLKLLQSNVFPFGPNDEPLLTFNNDPESVSV